MKRFFFGLAALSALVLISPGGASAARVARDMRAFVVNASVFEVVARSGAGAGDYWCGAADYAQRLLGADWGAQIYIVRGRGLSVATGRKSAVQFTLNAAAAGVTPRDPVLVMNRLLPGDHMSVQQAMTFCARAVLVP